MDQEPLKCCDYNFDKLRLLDKNWACPNNHYLADLKSTTTRPNNTLFSTHMHVIMCIHPLLYDCTLMLS